MSSAVQHIFLAVVVIAVLMLGTALALPHPGSRVLAASSGPAALPSVEA